MTLSIITINRNNLTGLRKTVESVFSQLFQDFEYLVIDGGSTDGSLELIKQHQSKLAYWHSKLDNGIYDAVNQGIAKAKGKYILFLHSGDYLLHTDVLKQVFSTHSDIDVLYADARRLNLQSGESELYQLPDKLTQFFFYRYSLCHQSMFFKRELFKKFGSYRKDLKIVSDWAYNLKLFLSDDCTWKHLPIATTFYDQTGLSSTNLDLLDAERSQVLSELFTSAQLAKFDRQYSFRQSILGKIAIKLRLIQRW